MNVFKMIFFRDRSSGGRSASPTSHQKLKVRESTARYRAKTSVNIKIRDIFSIKTLMNESFLKKSQIKSKLINLQCRYFQNRKRFTVLPTTIPQNT